MAARQPAEVIDELPLEPAESLLPLGGRARRLHAQARTSLELSHHEAHELVPGYPQHVGVLIHAPERDARAADLHVGYGHRTLVAQRTNEIPLR